MINNLFLLILNIDSQGNSNQIKYIGCAIDQSTRDISYNYISYSSLTIDYCAIHCNAYSYFGMQVGYGFYLINCINFEIIIIYYII